MVRILIVFEMDSVFLLLAQPLRWPYWSYCGTQLICTLYSHQN